MALIYVLNITSASNVVIGDNILKPGDQATFDRKEIVVARYMPYEYDTPNVYNDIFEALDGGYVSVTYLGSALTTATLANLDDLDVAADGVTRSDSVNLTDGGVAGTLDVEYWTAPAACKIVGFKLGPSTAAATDVANFAQFLVEDETNANTLNGVGSSTETTVGAALVQWIFTDLPLTATVADLILAAGDMLSITLDKQGAGVVCNGISISILYQLLA